MFFSGGFIIRLTLLLILVDTDELYDRGRRLQDPGQGQEVAVLQDHGQPQTPTDHHRRLRRISGGAGQSRGTVASGAKNICVPLINGPRSKKVLETWHENNTYQKNHNGDIV